MEGSGTLDPSWNTIVGELRSHGVDPRIVEDGNADFVQGFLTGYKAAKANPASDDERESPFIFVDPEIEQLLRITSALSDGQISKTLRRKW
jgi:hypothetical protein